MPRTIRFDQSDTHVFEVAAEPGEWAVSGAFAFAGLAPCTMSGKTRQAFASGWLGLTTFGRSTFVAVAKASEAERDLAHMALARHLVEAWGAPDLEAALPAAAEEIAFVADLCAEAPINTLFALSREFDETGRIREAFRDVPPPGEAAHARIWDVVDDNA